jgi:hypothetical protein
MARLRKHLGLPPDLEGSFWRLGRETAPLWFNALNSASHRHVLQPCHIPVHPVAGHEAERGAGGGEVGFAGAEHDRVQVDPVLIDQPKPGQALRQLRSTNFNLPGKPVFQVTDHRLEIFPDQSGVGVN